MRMEIYSAANFLVQLLRIKPNNGLTEFQLSMLKVAIAEVLCCRYEEHWFPEKPAKGSGYRCIRINKAMDPVLAQAGHKIGLATTRLSRLFPSELTLWIDPAEVSYRIGEDGSICVLYEEGKSPQPPAEPNTNPGGNSANKTKANCKEAEAMLILDPRNSFSFEQTTTTAGCKEAMLIIDPRNSYSFEQTTTTAGCKEAMLILDPHNSSYSFEQTTYVSG